MEGTTMATPNTQVASKSVNGASAALEAVNAIQAPAVQPSTVNAPTVTATPAQPTYEQLAAMVAELQRQAEANKPRPAGAIHFAIGEKGGVMVMGLGRFPVTLYQEQWDKFIGSTPEDMGAIPDLKAFIAENRSKLSVKPAKGSAKK
jgi:hypothetical protein